MSRFKVRVEGFQIPDGDEYTLNAENEGQAKLKALERFEKDFHKGSYDYVEITIIAGGKKMITGGQKNERRN